MDIERVLGARRRVPSIEARRVLLLEAWGSLGGIAMHEPTKEMIDAAKEAIFDVEIWRALIDEESCVP
jgi:hypothetical protein